MDILRDSALYVPAFDKKLSRMCDRNYNNPNFSTKHLLTDVLKYKYQPKKRSKSWLLTIYEHRKRINKALKNSPSLKRYYQEKFVCCYQEARKMASIETGLNITIFPEDCLFKLELILTEDYLPN